MSQPVIRAGPLRWPLILRHVAASREALAGELLPDFSPQQEQTWWELVDAAGDESRPPSAVAVTGPAGRDATIPLLAAAGEDRDTLTQLVDMLTVALRSTSAEKVAVVGPVDPIFGGVLRRAGFVPTAGSGRSGHTGEQFQLEL